MKKKAFALLTVGALAIGGGITAATTDLPVLAWQKIGPMPESLKTSAEGLSAAQVKRDIIGSDNVVLAVPEAPSGDLVIWAHGHGGTADELFDGPQHVGTRDMLLDAGYSLASSDGAGQAWGNPESVDAYAALHDWATEQTTVKSVVLVGQSMGGLASLRLVDELPNVRAWIGLAAVCNLDTVAPAFDSAYEAWGVDSWESVPELSPIVPEADIPMLFIHSPNDSVVPKDTNADTCAAAANDAGADAQVVRAYGDHGNQSVFQPDRMIGFLADGGV